MEMEIASEGPTLHGAAKEEKEWRGNEVLEGPADVQHRDLL